MSGYVVDTNALYWHLTNSSRLSPTAREVFDNAQKGRGVLIVPHLTLAELYYLLRKRGQVELYDPFLVLQL